jgi:hypothetical protein
VNASRQGLSQSLPEDQQGGTVDERRESTMFDRFAESASSFASHAVFFGACVLMIAVWVPSYILIRNLTRGS